jgi:hypothetical protein
MHYQVSGAQEKLPRSSVMRTAVVAAGLAFSLALAAGAQAQSKPKFKLAYAKCAHCMSMALVPELARNVDIEGINFTAGSDALTALVSRRAWTSRR